MQEEVFQVHALSRDRSQASTEQVEVFFCRAVAAICFDREVEIK